MKTKVLVAVISVACMFVMLAGMSIAQDQSPGQNGNANTKTGGSANANRSANANAGRSSNSADVKFAMATAMDGMTEVELGRLAVQKGTSDAVKQFGQRMIDDHTNANQQLTQLASSKGITLPTSLDAKHAAMVQKFQAMSGAAFDRAYAKQMVQDHKKAVAMFQKEAASGMDAEMKAFASNTLPILQGHLSMAQAMNGGTGSGGVNSNTNSSNMNSNSNMRGNTNSNTNSNRSMNSNANNSNQK